MDRCEVADRRSEAAIRQCERLRQRECEGHYTDEEDTMYHIRELQAALNAAGATPQLAVDGIFGVATASAYAAHIHRRLPVPDCIDAVREYLRGLVPHVSNAEAIYGPREADVMDDPKRRGACLLKKGCLWEANLRDVTLPGGFRVRLHKRVVPLAIAAFADVLALHHDYEILKPVGSWCLRRIRWIPGKPLSNHGRGCALDLNPESNAFGTHGDLPEAILDCFRAWGWNCGRDWKPASQQDPMHVELVRRG